MAKNSIVYVTSNGFSQFCRNCVCHYLFKNKSSLIWPFSHGHCEGHICNNNDLCIKILFLCDTHVSVNK